MSIELKHTSIFETCSTLLMTGQDCFWVNSEFNHGCGKDPEAFRKGLFSYIKSKTVKDHCGEPRNIMDHNWIVGSSCRDDLMELFREWFPKGYISEGMRAPKAYYKCKAYAFHLPIPHVFKQLGATEEDFKGYKLEHAWDMW